MAQGEPANEALKARQREAWGGPAAGYHEVALEVQPLAERLLEAVGMRPGDRVLDAAAGTGVTATAAARRGARVTALDFAAALLDAGKLIAERGLRLTGISWMLGDVQAMPFPDGSFDVVVSTVGVIFAPDHRRTASELRRVLRADGRLGLACATPEGTVGRLNAVRSRYAPPPATAARPHEWGRPAYVRELLADVGFADIECREAWFPLVAGSAELARDRWIRGFGPMRQTFAALDESGREALRADLLALFREFEVAGVGVVMPREALLVLATAG